MEFLQITSPDDYRIQEIYDSYASSFPEDERRDWYKFVRLFEHPQVKVISVLCETKKCRISYSMGIEFFYFCRTF